jgi:hypothetical protein
MGALFQDGLTVGRNITQTQNSKSVNQSRVEIRSVQSEEEAGQKSQK